MKKIMFFLAVLMMATIAMAQEKVAILETVDKAGDIPYGIKLLLRSSLTSAISNTPGYEGYDRVDMAAIAGEQEFQRTGNVSDDQIRQLGVASGAKYVLVAEAAKYDEVRIIITAKLLDVETFGVKSSAVQITGTSAGEMQKSCEQLAKQLIKTDSQSQTPKATREKVVKEKKTKVKYTRPTWFGMSVEAGVDDFTKLVDPYANDYWDRYDDVMLYNAGFAADLSFPIFNWFSFGPYGGINVIPYSSGKMMLKYMAGGMMKITFNNNFGFLFGYGIVACESTIMPQVRGGIKFKSPVFMTWSIYVGTGGDLENGGYFNYGGTIGIGFSFGGKLKVVE